ncbi:quinone oxidoreductase [Paracoccus sp. Z118]|uniref:quinone oxidoreductase family protein n=1 Tax=Paracoccus sp. Z118 TaxID=2851017 RepID=UPI001C2C4BF7|nr:quinone oxidoreductase [Paracoccus sp. Z118]MBV0891609.1 quinone oxidoreductase [Paracoccus sp. Z118]
MRNRFIQGRDFGSPDLLALQTEELAAPGPGQILVRHSAIGVNFIDILLRRGELARDLPYRLGLEGAGEVVAVADDVGGFAPGDRIVYAGGPTGSYAEARVLPAARAVRLPDGIDDDTAAAVFFKGLTADYLVHRMRPIAPGDTVLFTAAAGGVGQLAVPMLKAAGATVIGTVGSEEKIAAATGVGCDHVLVLGSGDAAERIREWTGGRGVAIAYDSIGRATFDLSLASLARFGLLVSYGWSSGDVEPVALAHLRDAGSLFVTRPTVAHYIQERGDLIAGAERVFAALKDGVIRANIHAKLPLAQAGAAHELIESRASQGSVILDPR